VASREQAFEGFAAARSGALFRTAWLLTGDWQLSEDLVQESLARVYLHWRRIERMDNPAAYARKILVNTHTSYRRLRRNTERPAVAPTGPAEPTESWLPGAVADDDPGLRLTLLDGLARLDRDDRTVLVLRYWEDLDVNATAELMDLSPATVRTRCVRALARLRAVLGADLHDLPIR
jgi:RNA polymerase sigma-70 factor (sigma-E family)